MYYVNFGPKTKQPKQTEMSTKTDTKTARKQARVIGVQTAVVAAREFALQWARERMGEDWANGKLCWAQHPAEGDKPVHWHIVLEFSSVTDWTSLRKALMEFDRHSWSDSLSKIGKSRRYLGHRDNPLKSQIPESDIHFEGPYTEQEISEALAPSPSAGLECLVRELARYTSSGTTPAAALVDLLRKGYEPREVSSVVGAFRALDGLLGSGAARGLARALDGDRKPELTPDDPAFWATPDELESTDSEFVNHFADSEPTP